MHDVVAQASRPGATDVRRPALAAALLIGPALSLLLLRATISTAGSDPSF